MERIAVISDPQVNLKHTTDINEYDYLYKCFKNMEVDSVIVCGDITENANEDEWCLFLDAFKNDNNKSLFIVPGNMDLTYTQNGKLTYDKMMFKYCGKIPEHLFTEYESVLFSLFGISIEKYDDNAPISEYQLQKLDALLKSSAARGVPTIVFGHYILNDTIDINWKFAELGPQSEVIKELFKKYGNKVFYFSGHIHRGLMKKEGSTVKQVDNVTYISTPSLCYPDNEHYEVDNGDIGTGFMVDITDDNVLIQGYDFINGNELEDFRWKINLGD